MRPLLIAAGLFVIGAVGLGIAVFAIDGDRATLSAAEISDVLSGIDEADPPLVGLGEASPPSPPSPLQAGWKTNFSKRLVPLSEFQSGGRGRTESHRSTRLDSRPPPRSASCARPSP